ncbi:hypothetical protein [Amycolatopsis magusensis]|uniref:hypothetical protein n=1 Tax=Amycolatopsis magusensis TaxID=882444 RepID=UPI0037B56DAE
MITEPGHPARFPTHGAGMGSRLESMSTPMDHDSADRISAAADRDPDSPTATSGFDDRAQDAADRNTVVDDPDEDFL